MAIEGIRCFGEDLRAALKTNKGKAILVTTIVGSVLAAMYIHGSHVPYAGAMASAEVALTGTVLSAILGHHKKEAERKEAERHKEKCFQKADARIATELDAFNEPLEADEENRDLEIPSQKSTVAVLDSWELTEWEKLVL